jgi:hypothetical protein
MAGTLIVVEPPFALAVVPRRWARSLCVRTRLSAEEKNQGSNLYTEQQSLLVPHALPPNTEKNCAGIRQRTARQSKDNFAKCRG